MGLKNTKRLREAGKALAKELNVLHATRYEGIYSQNVAEWEAALFEYEELLNKRKDKKNRKQEAKKLAKARGENKN